MLKIIKMFGFHLCCLHLVLKENQSPYLVPFNEVASVLQCVRDGGRLEFQCMDPRLSAGHGFTYTWTLSVTHTHTSWRCSDSDTWKLHLCHVRAQTPQKSGRGAQLQQQQHPLLFRFSLGCTCLPFLSVYSFESQPSRSSFSLLSPLFSYPSLLSSASLLLFVPPSLSCWCCISQRDRLKQMPSWETRYVCVSMYVCVCVRALPPQIDSSATCAQLQLPTDGGGIREGRVTGRGREKERREWERWREMKREEGRGKRERIKC